MEVETNTKSAAERESKSISALVFLCTVCLTLLAFPPLNLPETAFLFSVPLTLWAYSHPPKRRFLLTAFLSGFVSWLGLLHWLRHITWIGTLSLAFILALFWTMWALALYSVLPKLRKQKGLFQVIGLFGLAAIWVALEYLRTHLLTGFPWLPLAASQWQRPVFLSIASYTGFYGVSFLLIFFNLALSNVLLQRRLCFEFYLSLFFLFASFFLFLSKIHFPQKTFFSVGLVQPNIPPSLKWDPQKATENLSILEELTLSLQPFNPDILIWPETATPCPLVGSDSMLQWTTALVKKCHSPLLLGSMAQEGKDFYNGVFLLTPQEGLSLPFYGKRKRVPFGEYIPMKSLYPKSIKKVIPFEEEIIPGKKPTLLCLNIRGTIWNVGPLICYEDVFPEMGRSLAQEGADFLLVLTNDAWYGEEGGAYQHMTHSVLQAVQTGRPVVRCGNNGWSGWIDTLGRIRYVLKKEGIYVRGTGICEVMGPEVPRVTFYVRYGDWFAILCCGVAGWVLLLLRNWD